VNGRRVTIPSYRLRQGDTEDEALRSYKRS
jgi:ribosomal protein S4